MDRKDIYFVDVDNIKRLKKTNETLLRGLESVDFRNDPQADQKIERYAKLYKELASEIKNINDATLEAERLRIEEEKNKADIENTIDSLSLQEAKQKDDAENNFIRNVIDFCKIGATVGAAAITGACGIYKFKESTKKERDEAYLTVTDKTTVQDSLRTTSPWWKFW